MVFGEEGSEKSNKKNSYDEHFSAEYNTCPLFLCLAKSGELSITPPYHDSIHLTKGEKNQQRRKETAENKDDHREPDLPYFDVWIKVVFVSRGR
tara:strand:+ start:142 stop:423 length:282 start_codon:yes stop_codon:yes gene_type:complete